MSDITQCPQCNTRFKVTEEQLDAHEGMVRCGVCQAIFNAKEHLSSDEPSPQLSLPIMQEELPQESLAAKAEENATPPAQPSQESVEFAEFVESVESAESAQPPEPESIEPGHVESEAVEPIESAAPVESIVFTEPAKAGAATTLAQQVVVADELRLPTHELAARKRTWPWAIGSLLLLVVLLAQAAYYFRIDLAAQLPGLKPALQSYCQLLNCSIPLPRKADLVSIESSDMEASPSTANTITLSAILRNRAPYAQAYPNLELTLTDAQDKTVARRFIRPSEYLKPDVDEAAGAPPHREISIKLYLDTADLKAAGYRLFLFYP